VVTVAVGAVVGCLAAGAGISAIGSVPVVLAVVGIGAGLIPVALLWQGSNGVVRGLAVGLAAGWVVVIGLAGWYSNVGPSNPGPERTEAKLRQLAASTDTPIYYLGSSFHGEDLEYAAVLSGNGEVVGDDTLDPGKGLLLVYGEKCSQRTCAAKIALSIEPWASDLTHGCRQLGSLRGVPAVSTSEAVILVTGDILVRVGGGTGATELAGDARRRSAWWVRPKRPSATSHRRQRLSPDAWPHFADRALLTDERSSVPRTRTGVAEGPGLECSLLPGVRLWAAAAPYTRPARTRSGSSPLYSSTTSRWPKAHGSSRRAPEDRGASGCAARPAPSGGRRRYWSG
jgi:hypothetical protein